MPVISNQMPPVFNNPEHQAVFEQDGYIVIPNFLTSEEISELTKVYQSMEHPNPIGFHRTYDNPDKAYKTRLSQAIHQTVTPKTTALLSGHRYFLASYMVKEPGSDTAFELHQNWNFVDESKHQSVVLWIPLVDTNEQNGTMYVVKGSNRLMPTFRGGPYIPSVFENILSHIKQHYLTPIPLKAGDALILDDALLHYTSPNHSNHTRYAMAQVMIPKAATPVYYYLSEPSDTRLHVFEIDMDFYLFYNNRYPKGEYPQDMKHIGTIPYSHRPLNEIAFDRLYFEHNPQLIKRKPFQVLRQLKNNLLRLFKSE